MKGVEPVVFCDDLVRADIELARADVCVRLKRSPTKPTPNEDAAAVLPFDADTLVLAVADGVGGSPGGREAAQLAMRSLETAAMTREGRAGPIRSEIIDAVESVNALLIEQRRGSGTTIAVVEIVDSQLRSYHVGDSEVLVVGQRGKIRQRIVPHSPTGFAVEAGLLDEDAAIHHESRHILLNVVGTPSMRIEVGVPLVLQARDTVLIASDGLFDNLFIDEVVEVIRCGPLAEAADRLVALADIRMAQTSGDGPSKPDDLAIVLYRSRYRKRERRQRS